MAAAAYPCVTGTDHNTLGPAASHLRSRPVSLEMLLRSGPRNCGQSDPCAAGSREATPAAPAPMIQPRRVYIQNFSSCVEKNNTFASSITRYSGLKRWKSRDVSWAQWGGIKVCSGRGFRPVTQSCNANLKNRGDFLRQGKLCSFCCLRE